MCYQLEYTPGPVGLPGGHRKLLISFYSSFMLVILLILSGHLVPALTAISRSSVRSGNMYLLHVDRYIRLVVMPNGRPFVKYATEVIVDWQCMHAFRYFINFMI